MTPPYLRATMDLIAAQQRAQDALTGQTVYQLIRAKKIELLAWEFAQRVEREDLPASGITLLARELLDLLEPSRPEKVTP